MITDISSDFASLDILAGSFSTPFYIFWNSYSLLLQKYGGYPTNISYRRTPSKYQSTDFPWPDLLNISGARYATEPQKLFAEILSKTPSFERPKSVKRTWPSASTTTLSGFKSLNIISLLCRYYIAKRISAA